MLFKEEKLKKKYYSQSPRPNSDELRTWSSCEDDKKVKVHFLVPFLAIFGVFFVPILAFLGNMVCFAIGFLCKWKLADFYETKK